jgi:hypothetical protein
MIAVLVAALLAAAAQVDTVYTLDGGRIAGTVLEESSTSGVTIQTGDGSIRRIEPSQVVRIEFADGTVSTPRPPPPPPPAAAAPRSPAAEGSVDTVHFLAGGRVRGTVMEENATTGVKIRRLDGSIHPYSAADVARIEYADGTVSTLAPARTPAPAPGAKSGEGAVDNVYFLAGGRVRGTVIEESPKTGVKVRLLDGSIQTYSRDDLVRIEYSDGSISRRTTPVAPVAPPVAPQPAAAPPPHGEGKPHPFPLFLSLGVGGTFLGGEAADGTAMSSFLETEQVHVSSELGLRLSPGFALGVYGDVGTGDAAPAIREQCQVQGIDCVGATGRWGVLARHTWAPLSRRPFWLSVGTGWEFGGVTVAHRGGDGDSDLFRYTGREYLRLGAGVDFRSNQVIALGLYGSFAVGEYDEYEDPVATVSVTPGTHTTAQVGIRLTLFP